MTEGYKQIQIEVFTEYRTRIFGYISKKSVPESDRDDVFGEILLKAAQQSQRYDSAKASVSTWIYIITRSVVADYFKKRKELYPLREDIIADMDTEDDIEYEEELRNLAWALKRLPERERQVVVSRFYNDMEYAQIAVSMHLTEVNVRKICSRALQKLRDNMAF